MAWCRQATSNYLRQYWPSSILPHGIISPQWALWILCVVLKWNITDYFFYHVTNMQSLKWTTICCLYILSLKWMTVFYESKLLMKSCDVIRDKLSCEASAIIFLFIHIQIMFESMQRTNRFGICLSAGSWNTQRTPDTGIYRLWHRWSTRGEIFLTLLVLSLSTR